MQHMTRAANEVEDQEACEVEYISTLRVPCEVYSRIIGYLRPVQNWNQGKKQEFVERQTFRLSEEAVLRGEKPRQA